MPHDLFGDVVVRPPSARARRSSVVVFSVVTHAAALVVVLIAPLLAIDALPIPKRALEFFGAPAIITVVVPPARRPAPARSAGSAMPTTPASASKAAAPIVAPKGFTPETGLEAGSPSAPTADLLRVGIVEGIPTSDIGSVSVPPAPEQTGPVRAADLLRQPRKLVDVAPKYPAVAQAARVQGTVIIEAIIDVHGNVEAARIVKRVAFLDQAALDAVRQWKFTPTVLRGVPVPVIMTVTVNFTLQ